jgi:hypothetical protein
MLVAILLLCPYLSNAASWLYDIVHVLLLVSILSVKVVHDVCQLFSQFM